jgi:hypothetical protein
MNYRERYRERSRTYQGYSNDAGSAALRILRVLVFSEEIFVRKGLK